MPLGMGFQDKLGGLIRGGNPLLDLSLGLLQTSGPSLQPHSFGQDVAGAVQFASQRDIEAQKNQLLRDQISQQGRRQNAMQRLTGILSGGEEMDQAGMLGLFSEIAPEQLVQQMMGQMFPDQERAEPSLIRELDALELPRSLEGIRQLVEAKGGSDADFDRLTQQYQMELMRMQYSNAQREEADRVRKEGINQRTQVVTTRRGLDNIREAAELNEFLSTTALRSGATFSDLKRTVSEGLAEVKEFFGVDTEEAREINAAFDRFNKLTSELIIEDIGRLSGSGLGAATNQRLELLGNAMAGAGVAPEANAKIFGGAIQDILDMAEIEGIEIEDPDSFRSLADDLLSVQFFSKDSIVDLPDMAESVNAAVQQAMNDASKIAQLSLTELQSLMQNAGELSDEALEAAARRWDELNAD